VKITVVGRGNVGGGLAKRWQAAGHDVQALGRDGGHGSDADVVVVALPSGAIAEGLGKVSGIEGKTTIDTIVGGPVAKSFNINFAALYDRIDEQPEKPGNFYVAEDEAREVTEQLIHDAGYDPINVGGLENARLLEDQIDFIMAVLNGGLGQSFYRYWS
jgi:predicted dinucleotide-binding enzyme